MSNGDQGSVSGMPGAQMSQSYEGEDGQRHKDKRKGVSHQLIQIRISALHAMALVNSTLFFAFDG